MATLAVLRHEEGIYVDAERLVPIYHGRAKREAEAVLERAIEDLASRLREIQLQFDEADAQALVRSVRLVARMAERLGMTSFTTVANDLIATTEAGDGTAQAATLARLLRVADRAVTALWDLRDMTM